MYVLRYVHSFWGYLISYHLTPGIPSLFGPYRREIIQENRAMVRNNRKRGKKKREGTLCGSRCRCGERYRFQDVVLLGKAVRVDLKGDGVGAADTKCDA